MNYGSEFSISSLTNTYDNYVAHAHSTGECPHCLLWSKKSTMEKRPETLRCVTCGFEVWRKPSTEGDMIPTAEPKRTLADVILGWLGL